MKTQLLTLALAAAISPIASSAVINHAGYSLDTNTNIVSGGGLEWLQWDETLAMSINGAVSSFSGDGWRLATLNEMTDMLNGFFGSNFVAVENNNIQQVIGAAAPGLLDTVPHDIFVTMFGETFVPGSNRDGLDPQRRSVAHFGLDDNNNGWHGRAQIAGDYQQNNGVNINAVAWMYGEISTSTADIQNGGSGVALVRAPSAVPIPAAAWLFGSVLAGITGARKLRT